MTVHAAQRTSIATASLVAALAVVVVATLLARGYAERRFDRAGRDRAADAAALASIAVSENIDRLIQPTVALAADPVLRDALRSGDVRTQQQLLASVQRHTAGARLVALADPTGRVLRMAPSDPAVIGRTFARRDWYRGVQRTSPYLSPAYRIAAFDRPRAVSIAARVTSGSTTLGIVNLVQETQSFGRAIERVGRQPSAPSLVVLDQHHQVVAGTAAPTGDDVIRTSRPIGSTGWQLVATITQRDAQAGLGRVRTATVVFGVVVCGLLLVLGWLLRSTSRGLAAEQQLAQRREQAFELNDAVVQRLAVAHLALSIGERATAMASLEAALDGGRRIIGDLAKGRLSYARRVPVHEDLAADARTADQEGAR